MPRRAPVGAGIGALLLALFASFAAYAAEEPGRFDYWVLSLSWSPQYCKTHPGGEQCGQPRGFIVHGLWPQYERGYPDYCGNRERVPQEIVERILPLTPDDGLIQQQWRKHGSCSGMPVGEYFLNLERVRRGIVIPEIMSVDTAGIESTAREIEETFIEANPKLDHDSIALLCKGRWLTEIRVCMDREFKPRACGEGVEDRCDGAANIRANRYRRAQ